MVSKDEKVEKLNAFDIHSLYDKIMQGFDGKGFVSTSELNEDGNYHMLYAPGYEDTTMFQPIQ